MHLLAVHDKQSKTVPQEKYKGITSRDAEQRRSTTEQKYFPE